MMMMTMIYPLGEGEVAEAAVVVVEAAAVVVVVAVVEEEELDQLPL
jgi:hypothetical protein